MPASNQQIPRPPPLADRALYDWAGRLVDVLQHGLDDIFGSITNQRVLLDSAGRHWLAYDAAANRLKYYVDGTVVFSIDNSGNVRALGTITASTTP
jgi:hypothetical protein